MRFNAESARPTVTTYDRVLEHLAEHRDQKVDDVARALQIRTADVRRALKYGTTHGTTHAGPSGRRDKAGRPIRDKVWNLAPQPELWPVPTRGTIQDEPHNGHRGSVARPVSIGDGRPDEPPDEPSSLDVTQAGDATRQAPWGEPFRDGSANDSAVAAIRPR